MSRLIKEREVDQELWENLNVDLVDTQDYLNHLHQLQDQATEDYQERQHILGEAKAMEAEAHADETAAGAAASRARERRIQAHKLRTEAQRQESASHKRLETTAKLIKLIETHVNRDRKALVDWAITKDFAEHMLPELQLFAKGGLQQLVRTHRLHRAGLSQAEAEAV